MEGSAKNLLEDPDVRAIVVNYRDITERKQAEDKLAANEQRLSVLMENLPGMVYRCRNDPDWSMEFMSSGCVDLTGYSADDFLSGRIRYHDIIHPDDRDRVWNEVQDALAGKTRFRIEYRIRTATGEEKQVWEQGCGIWESNADVLALEGFITDVTERRKIEDELRTKTRDLNERVKEITCINIISAIFDEPGSSLDEQIERVVNTIPDAMQYAEISCARIGLDDKTFSTTNFDHPVATLSRDIVVNKTAIGTIDIGYLEQRPGTDTDPFLDEEKDLVSIIASKLAQHLENKRIEQELVESERFANATINGLSAHIAIIDRTGTILHINRAWKQFAENNSTEIRALCTGANYLDVCDRASRLAGDTIAAQFADCIRSVLAGEISEFVLEYPCHSPEEQRWFQGRITPFPGEGPAKAIVAHENITDRKLSEAALGASEERLRLALDAAHMGTFDWDIRKNHITWSRWHEELWGYESGEFDGTYEAFEQRIHPDDLPGINADIERCIDTHVPFIREFRVVWPDDSIHWIQARGEFTYPADDSADRMRGVVIEITERKQTEQALRREHDFSNALLNSLPGIVYCFDENLNFLRWNRNFENISGYTGEEIANSRPLDFFSGDDRELIRRCIGEVFEKGQAETEAGFVSQDGKVIPYYFTGMHADIGGKTCLVAVGIDITAIRQKDEALRISEAQLSNALEIARAGYWEYDVATDRFTFNDHFYAIFRTSAEREGGYSMSPAEYAGRFVHPDDRDVVDREVKAALETTDPDFTRELEHRAIFADGETGYIAVRVFIKKDDSGKTVKTYGINQDITQRKEAEQRLTLLNFALNHASEASYLMDRQGRFLDVNREACRALGYTRDELLAMKVFDIDPGLTIEAWNRYWKTIKKSGTISPNGK
jgi:PAS domain S-box-containing protein